jgi:hypothetical protein
LGRFPFGSLVPLWSRQIPYTMAKFFFFEKVGGTASTTLDLRRCLGRSEASRRGCWCLGRDDDDYDHDHDDDDDGDDEDDNNDNGGG